MFFYISKIIDLIMILSDHTKYMLFSRAHLFTRLVYNSLLFTGLYKLFLIRNGR